MGDSAPVSHATAQQLVARAEQHWSSRWTTKQRRQAVQVLRQAQDVDHARRSLNALARSEHLPTPTELLRVVMGTTPVPGLVAPVSPDDHPHRSECETCKGGKGWVELDDDYVAPCHVCRPITFERWKGQHFEANHWCEECESVRTHLALIPHLPQVIHEPLPETVEEPELPLTP